MRQEKTAGKFSAVSIKDAQSKDEKKMEINHIAKQFSCRLILNLHFQGVCCCNVERLLKMLSKAFESFAEICHKESSKSRIQKLKFFKASISEALKTAKSLFLEASNEKF